MTAFPVRFNAPIIETKKLLDTRQLGDILACSTANQGQLPTDSWFVNKDLAGGGAITDHTVHLVDIMRWYLGCEVIEVFAEASQILYPDLDVETAGLVMLSFENGVYASIDCSWSRPPNFPTWGGLQMEIICEQGVLSVDAFKQYTTVYRNELQRPTQHFWGSNMDKGLINDFVQSIEKQRKPSITGYDGLKAVEVVSAAYQSLKTRQPVIIPTKVD